MKVLVLADQKSMVEKNSDLLIAITKSCESLGFATETIVLSGDEIKPCIGCYRCWVKTPGLCINSDDNANLISRRLINSKIVILVSEITYGGYSYDLKAYLDRKIPNISPYFEIVEKEVHHAKRYPNYPYWLAIGYGNYSDLEKEVFEKLAKRNSLNFRSPGYSVIAFKSGEELDYLTETLTEILTREFI